MTNNTAQVTLNGKKYLLYFDLNTYETFERITGQFFLDFLMEIQEAILSVRMDDAAHVAKLSAKDQQALGLQMMRKISLSKVRALLWAALHTYDNDDNPVYPLTIGAMSRMITVENFGTILPALWSGANSNMPESKERPTKGKMGKSANPSSQKSGGEESGPSDEDVLDSLEKSSAG